MQLRQGFGMAPYTSTITDLDWWISLEPDRLNGHPLQLFTSMLQSGPMRQRKGGERQTPRTINRRSLEPQGSRTSHQHSGAKARLPTEDGAPTATAHPPVGGQYHSCGLRQQERGNSLLIPHDSSSAIVVSDTRKENLADSPTHSWSRQLRCGPCIETDRISYRMDLEQTCFQRPMHET